MAAPCTPSNHCGQWPEKTSISQWLYLTTANTVFSNWSLPALAHGVENRAPKPQAHWMWAPPTWTSSRWRRAWGLTQRGRQRPRRATRHGRAPQHRDEQSQHHQAEYPFERFVVQIRNHASAHRSTHDQRHQQRTRIREARNPFGAKTPSPHDALDEDTDSIRRVGDGTGKTEQHEQRNGEERATAGKRIDDAGDKSADDQQAGFGRAQVRLWIPPRQGARQGGRTTITCRAFPSARATREPTSRRPHE